MKFHGITREKYEDQRDFEFKTNKMLRKYEKSILTLRLTIHS